MEHGFCPSSRQCSWCFSLLFIGNTRASTWAVFSCWREVISWGFGPLLLHFSRNPNLYLGRGASLLIWSPHIPISFVDFHRAWTMIWPVLSENLLGISTHTSQAIIFYRPPVVTCRKRGPGSGRCPAFLALASSCRVSHTRLGARCLARGWSAPSVSEQRTTPDQSLDSLPSRPSMLRWQYLSAHGQRRDNR